MLAFFLLGIALLGLPLGLLVLRGDPKRWDNRVFAVTVFVDSVTAATRSVLVFLGHSLTDVIVLRTGAVGSVITAYCALEFAYSFPFNRQPPPAHRAVAMFGAGTSLCLMLHPATWEWFSHYCNYCFFIPYFLLTLALLFRNYRDLAGRRDLAGIPLVLGGIAFRWAAGMFTFLVAKHVSPAMFAAALHFEVTAATFIGYLLFGYAVLKYNLFRVRGVVAEIVYYGGGAISTLVLVAFFVDFDLAHVPPGAPQRASLVAIALIPAGVLALWRWLMPRFEEAVLCELDPRRAKAKAVLTRVVRGAERGLDLDTVFAMSIEAFAEITAAAQVRFLRGPAPWPGPEPTTERLGPALAAHLAGVEAMFLHRPQADGLPADAAAELEATPGDLLVCCRRAGELFGVFSIDRGQFDRDAVMTLITLSEHLALRIENYRLFAQTLGLQAELEEARRLASLGSFAAAIAHDIRTPLTSVQMNVQILRGKVDLPPDDMEYFDIALDELKRLNASISEILDYAKPVQLQTTPVELGAIAEEALKRMGPVLEERRLSLEKSHGDVPTVLADPQRIRQILRDLAFYRKDVLDVAVVSLRPKV